MNTDSIIYWSQKRLTWKDFKGPVPGSRLVTDEVEAFTEVSAETASSIYAQCKIKNDTLSYTIYAYFMKYQSWTASTSKHDLAHEQLHFNIAELVARRLRKFLLSGKIHTYILNGTFGATFDSMAHSVNSIQTRYDIETDHGADSLSQLKWNKYVRRSLESLCIYNRMSGEIYLKGQLKKVK